MDKLTVGQLVKLAPQWMDSPEDADVVYRVIEDSGDRLIIELVCDMPIPPQELVKRDMIVLAEEGACATK